MNDRHEAPPQPSEDHRSTHAYLCTGCPLGRRLEVDAVNDDVVEVRGFSCRRGERYGRQEFLDPRRPLSTTVWIDGAAIRRVPVRTAEPIPRDQLRAVVAALRGLTIAAPARRGEVVVADILGSGVDVIVTRDLPSLSRHEDSSRREDGSMRGGRARSRSPGRFGMRGHRIVGVSQVLVRELAARPAAGIAYGPLRVRTRT